MQPEKYLKDLESSHNRRRILEQAALSLIFFSTFLFFGPLIHEAAHILVMQFYNCFYSFEPSFSLLSGLHAKVAPLCTLETPQLLIFYSIGYPATLFAAGFSSFAALTDKKGARYFAAASSGLFLSVLLSIGGEGDIQNAVEVLGLSRSYSTALVVFILTGVLLSSLETLELFMDLERQE